MMPCGRQPQVILAERARPTGRCRALGMEARATRWIAPFAVLKGRHVEVQEHAEAQVYELLLQVEEGFFSTSGAGWLGLFGARDAGGGEHGYGCGFSGQAEEVSSCCHRDMKLMNEFQFSGLFYLTPICLCEPALQP